MKTILTVFTGIKARVEFRLTVAHSPIGDTKSGGDHISLAVALEESPDTAVPQIYRNHVLNCYSFHSRYSL
jgi:hypothetical protein